MSQDFSTEKSTRTSAGSDFSEVSLGKDLFIVSVGVVLILLGFLLFSNISGLGLKVIFPRFSAPVVDMYGEAIDTPQATIAEEAASLFFRIGILSGLVAVTVFVATFVLLRWSKRLNKKMMPHQNIKEPEGPTDKTFFS